MTNASNRWTVGDGFLDALKAAGEANAITEMLTLAVSISDQAARFDIEWGCAEVQADGLVWLDTAQRSAMAAQLPDEEARQRYAAQLVRALRFLELREHLVKHPTYPRLVRFAEEAPH